MITIFRITRLYFNSKMNLNKRRCLVKTIKQGGNCDINSGVCTGCCCNTPSILIKYEGRGQYQGTRTRDGLYHAYSIVLLYQGSV